MPNLWFMAAAFLLGVAFTYPQVRRRRVSPKLTVITDPSPTPLALGPAPDDTDPDDADPVEPDKATYDHSTDEGLADIDWQPKPRPAQVDDDHDSATGDVPWWDRSFIRNRPTEADTMAFLDLVRWTTSPEEQETNVEP